MKQALSVLALPAVLLIAACNPTASSDSGAGVGFGNYTQYQARQAAREAELEGRAAPAPLAISSESTGTPIPPTVAETAPETGTDLTAIAGAAIAEAEAATPETPATAAANNPEISDEQNFDAVAARETIESDAERLARLRAQRQQVAPQPVPDRPRDTGPNIVAYALKTTNAVGEAIYDRRRTSPERTERNCTAYLSPDRAQMAFLENGGPERDREGLDPDGDGFACDWSPMPFRAARGG